jgi:hypothetical protein
MNTQPDQQSASASGSVQIDPFKLEGFIREIKARQNLPLGILGGLGAAIVGAIIWALITVVTDYQIGWMAIGVGFLVGLAIRQFGQGIDTAFGISGAVLALLGCLAGNLFTIATVAAREEGLSLLFVLFTLIISPGLVLELMVATFTPIDLLFYGLAIYAGYKNAFRQIKEAELATLQA